MPPGKMSKVHLHRNNEMIVIVIEGYAATLIGDEMKPVYSGPGEFLYVPEGVPHAAVNLSTTDRLIAVEVRSDPHFNEDVEMTPHLEEKASKVVAHLHKHFKTGKLPLPKHWNINDVGPFKFVDEAV